MEQTIMTPELEKEDNTLLMMALAARAIGNGQWVDFSAAFAVANTTEYQPCFTDKTTVLTLCCDRENMWLVYEKPSIGFIQSEAQIKPKHHGMIF